MYHCDNNIKYNHYYITTDSNKLSNIKKNFPKCLKPSFFSSYLCSIQNEL